VYCLLACCGSLSPLCSTSPHSHPSLFHRIFDLYDFSYNFVLSFAGHLSSLCVYFLIEYVFSSCPPMADFGTFRMNSIKRSSLTTQTDFLQTLIVYCGMCEFFRKSIGIFICCCLLVVVPWVDGILSLQSSFFASEFAF